MSPAARRREQARDTLTSVAVGEEEDAASLAVGRDEVVHDDPGVLGDAPAKHTHPAATTFEKNEELRPSASSRVWPAPPLLLGCVQCSRGNQRGNRLTVDEYRTGMVMMM